MPIISLTIKILNIIRGSNKNSSRLFIITSSIPLAATRDFIWKSEIWLEKLDLSAGEILSFGIDPLNASSRPITPYCAWVYPYVAWWLNCVLKRSFCGQHPFRSMSPITVLFINHENDPEVVGGSFLSLVDMISALWHGINCAKQFLSRIIICFSKRVWFMRMIYGASNAPLSLRLCIY